MAGKSLCNGFTREGLKEKHKKRHVWGCGKGTYGEEQILQVREVTGYVMEDGKQNVENLKF